MTTAPHIPPDGFTKSRTITLDVYKKSKAPDFFLLTDGSYVMLHSSADNVRQDVLQRLTPPTIPAALSIGGTTLEPAQDGHAYSHTFTASGGTPPLHWTATGLPTGLTINVTTGEISGTTTQTGDHDIHVTVTDSADPQQTKSVTATLTVE